MVDLGIGSRGPDVYLIQTALNRAGYNSGAADGIFGTQTAAAVVSFQRDYGLLADGIVGNFTRSALYPYLIGAKTAAIRPGDTLYRLAQSTGVLLSSVEMANPGLDPLELRPGQTVTLPFPFDVVPTNIPYGSSALDYSLRGLKARYPFIETGTAGTSVMGKPIWYASIGQGQNQVFYNASHHANEWITSVLLMKFLEDYAKAYAAGGSQAGEIFDRTKIFIMPMVNPDGVDLVIGALTQGAGFERARALSMNYPGIPFPSGWKANINGIDTNLQYPAGWENARRIKFSQGYTMPGPRDYTGSAPLTAPESLAVYNFTQAHSFSLILSYHTQGRVIYWKYLDFEPEGALAIAELFAGESGYSVESTPYESGYAGYKDWFIYNFNRPGYTIEAGEGENPLPISQFPDIYRENEPILITAALVTA